MGFELELPRLNFREVQDVVHDAEQALARMLDRFREFLLLRIQHGFLQEPGHSHDAVNRRPDLVRHVREELGFRAVGGFRLVSLGEQGVPESAIAFGGEGAFLRLHPVVHVECDTDDSIDSLAVVAFRRELTFPPASVRKLYDDFAELARNRSTESLGHVGMCGV